MRQPEHFKRGLPRSPAGWSIWRIPMKMSLKPILAGNELASKLAAAACVVYCFSAFTSTPGLAQAASDKGTTSIQRGSEAEKALKMQEPSFQTREERLRAKPLDWNSTIGKPRPRRLTPAEKNALRNAPSGSTEGGASNSNADEEARRLHPDDWR
jgi:hypothetical protein